jgi:L-lactate dehydrogenase (cytochrome)
MTTRRLPRPSELAQFLRPPKVELNGRRRRLKTAHTINDLRRIARRRTPKAIFEYVDGGSEYERALARARSLFRQVELSPRVLRGVTEVDTSTRFLGSPIAWPWVFTPTGVTRVINHEGEKAVARSAASFGVPYGLSHISTTSFTDLAKAAPSGRRFYGITVPSQSQHDSFARLFDRLRDSGYEAICVTLDVATPGARLRDRYNGLTIPPRPTLKTIASGALHPNWWFNFLTTEPIDFPNVDVPPGGSVHQISAALGNGGAAIEDFDWVVQQWAGPVIAKGVATASDARMVVDHGATAVVLSSHGGRQHDQGPLPLVELPAAVAAVGGEAELYIDGGIMHAADIVAAVALGANGVFTGRPYLYGLMAGGQEGVDRANQILAEQLERTMRLLGVASLSQLTPDLVTLPAWARRFRPSETAVSEPADGAAAITR